jgi:TRAP-type uncharacterized transport system substrate-binding protein
MKETLIVLILGTATPGGGFPLDGAAFADMVNAQEPTLRIEPRNAKGSTENVPLLEAGKLDLALVAGDVASAALAKPDTPLRIVAAMYSSPGMLIVKGESPYRSLSVQQIFLEKAPDGPPMLMDGRADALWGAGVGWPAFAALARQGGRFIVPSAEEINTILAKNPALQPNTLPAKSYPGQDQALASVGSWSYVLGTKELKDETAYCLARETTIANTAACRSA